MSDDAWDDADQIDVKMNKYLQMEKIIETYYELPNISIQNLNQNQINSEINTTTNEIINILKTNCHREITSTFDDDIKKTLRKTFDDNCDFKNMFPMYLSKQYLNLLKIQLIELKKL